MQSLGPYEVEAELGRGAFGRVVRGRHRETGARHALKLLERIDPESVARFRREAEALAKLGAEGVVGVHDVWAEGGRLILALDLMEGGSLRERMDRPWPWREAATLVAGLARTLDRVHALGLVHRDVKPENVLFDGLERARLADFGCARDSTAGGLTATGEAIGTPHYMAPEQLQGAKVDGRADAWALGVILHELVAGARPFEGESPVALLVHMSQGAPPLAGPLEAVVARALEADPARRCDAATLAAGLEAALRGEVAARRPWWAAGVVLVLAVGAGARALATRRDGPAPVDSGTRGEPASPATAVATRPRLEAPRGARVPLRELEQLLQRGPAPEAVQRALVSGWDGELGIGLAGLLVNRGRDDVQTALLAARLAWERDQGDRCVHELRRSERIGQLIDLLRTIQSLARAVERVEQLPEDSAERAAGELRHTTWLTREALAKSPWREDPAILRGLFAPMLTPLLGDVVAGLLISRDRLRWEATSEVLSIALEGCTLPGETRVALLALRPGRKLGQDAAQREEALARDAAHHDPFLAAVHLHWLAGQWFAEPGDDERGRLLEERALQLLGLDPLARVRVEKGDPHDRDRRALLAEIQRRLAEERVRRSGMTVQDPESRRRDWLQALLLATRALETGLADPPLPLHLRSDRFYDLAIALLLGQTFTAPPVGIVEPPACAPQTAQEHILVAALHAHSGNPEEARRELDAAAAVPPTSGGPLPGNQLMAVRDAIEGVLRLRGRDAPAPPGG